MKCRNPGLVLAALLASGWGPGGDMAAPTLQEMRVAGHVLGFQETRVTGKVVVAIVYNNADSQSNMEALELASLLNGGLIVGGLVLRPRLIDQAGLADASGYGAIFATTGIDEALLGAVLKQRHVPCLTRHLGQVEHGACIVAIHSDPNISIVVSRANAARAGVRFATAFRMMVREL